MVFLTHLQSALKIYYNVDNLLIDLINNMTLFMEIKNKLLSNDIRMSDP